MHAALLLALGLVSQGNQNPSLVFRNLRGGQPVIIWIWCYEHVSWANDARLMVLGDAEPTRVELHTGNFRLYAENQEGATGINECVLAAGEGDRNRVEAAASLVAAPRLRWAEDQQALQATTLVRPNAPAANAQPSKEFRNETGRQMIRIWIYCYGEQRWEDARQPVISPPTKCVACLRGNSKTIMEPTPLSRAAGQELGARQF